MTLSAALKDYAGGPVSDRPVGITIGSGASAQTCTGTTASDGTVRCTIAAVHQPLNAAATVPLAARFAGDDSYLPSSASATLALQFMTGQAYGISAAINLPLLPPVTVPPQPDTGPVRTADATSTATPCSAAVTALVLNAKGLCPSVVTTLNPGTATGAAQVQQTTVGLPGLPVIALSGVEAGAVARCGPASGSATLTVTVGGVPIAVPTAPNSTVALPGGTTLIVNEQAPVAGAEAGTGLSDSEAGIAGTEPDPPAIAI